MRAKAPGKVVLSGAYVVLDGAPAVVAAVDRYAIAYASRRAANLTTELRAAFPAGDAPYVDSNALRYEGRKMGLGSSAAAIVAALTCSLHESSSVPPSETISDIVLERAFQAHRTAQGGGSGIDIVASTLGGVQVCSLEERGRLPRHQATMIPSTLVCEVWLCPNSASTPALLSQVQVFSQQHPATYQRIVAPAVNGAREFVSGLLENDAARVVRGAKEQRDSMAELGHATGAPILLSYMDELHQLANKQHGVFAQAGSGGGDVSLYFGTVPSSPHLRQRATAHGLRLLPLLFGAKGAHIVR